MPWAEKGAVSVVTSTPPSDATKAFTTREDKLGGVSMKMKSKESLMGSRASFMRSCL